ncbi:unnamed protein product [Soboliphyme baturini]|uniref:SH3 domain-containing protein n=1 Tax=Soboliphyme baturini TaxID=241478 RepID=A0A3P8E0L1_9BILA|nr:unnamed protein product [Soboliphyme baturini]
MFKARDEKFNESCRQFHANEKVCRSLLRDSQTFSDQIAKELSQLSSLASSLEAIAPMSHKTPGARKIGPRVWDQILDGAVLKNFVCFVLDSDPQTAEEEMKRAQAEYEALNSQLLNDLPLFNESSSRILNMSFGALAFAQQRFLKATKAELRSAFDRSSVHCAAKDEVVPQNLDCSLRLCRSKLEKLFANSNSRVTARCLSVIRDAAEHRPLMNRTRSVAVENLSKGITSSVQCDPLLLTHKYQSDKLFEVTSSYIARSNAELSLTAGNVVAVLVEKDPMGQTNRWCVDTGSNFPLLTLF